MSSVEEQIWNYIDGNCTPEKQQAISMLIEQDDAYRAKYLEILKLDQEFATMELDEPPMAFTYNVMEAIRAEEARKPLKATINTRLIKGLLLFFVFIIAALLIIMLSSINWSASAPAVATTAFKLPDLSKYLNGPVLKGFLFFDVVLGLFLFDAYLRRHNVSKN